MGVQIETEGIGANWYEQGLYENMAVVAAETVEGVFFEGVLGGSVTVVTPLELQVLLGFGIDWNIAAKHIELHGVQHWRTAFSDGWNQQTTNFSATSLVSHTQTVEGSTTWLSEGNFTLRTPAPQAAISITTVNDGRVFLCAGAGSLTLENTDTALQGDSTRVSGNTKLQLSGGGNSVLLNATEASMLCGGAGIKATAASTVISGAKVEIGLPNTPNATVATQPQVEALQGDITDLEAGARTAITELRTQLKSLEQKFSKLRIGKLD